MASTTDGTPFTSEHTFLDLLEDDELGALEVDVTLSVRQVTCIQFMLGICLGQGVALKTLQALAVKLGPAFVERYQLEFDSAQARIGLAMSDALGEPHMAVGNALYLAKLDQARAEVGIGGTG